MKIINLQKVLEGIASTRADEIRELEETAKDETDNLLPRGELHGKSPCCNAALEYLSGAVAICPKCRKEYLIDVLS